MRYPNKAVTFKESTFAYFVPIMKALADRALDPAHLFMKIPKAHRPSLSEYMDALNCLYVLNKIELDELTGTVHRVT